MNTQIASMNQQEEPKTISEKLVFGDAVTVGIDNDLTMVETAQAFKNSTTHILDRVALSRVTARFTDTVKDTVYDCRLRVLAADKKLPKLNTQESALYCEEREFANSLHTLCEREFELLVSGKFSAALVRDTVVLERARKILEIEKMLDTGDVTGDTKSDLLDEMKDNLFEYISEELATQINFAAKEAINLVGLEDLYKNAVAFKSLVAHKVRITRIEKEGTISLNIIETALLGNAVVKLLNGQQLSSSEASVLSITGMDVSVVFKK